MDGIVESGIPLTVDAYAHDTSDSAPKLVESSASSQIFQVFICHTFDRG